MLRLARPLVTLARAPFRRWFWTRARLLLAIVVVLAGVAFGSWAGVGVWTDWIDLDDGTERWDSLQVFLGAAGGVLGLVILYTALSTWEASHRRPRLVVVLQIHPSTDALVDDVVEVSYRGALVVHMFVENRGQIAAQGLALIVDWEGRGGRVDPNPGWTKVETRALFSGRGEHEITLVQTLEQTRVFPSVGIVPYAPGAPSMFAVEAARIVITFPVDDPDPGPFDLVVTFVADGVSAVTRTLTLFNTDSPHD